MSLLSPCTDTSPTISAHRISIPQEEMNPWTLPLKYAHVLKGTFLLQQPHIKGQLCVQATCVGILLTGMENKVQYCNMQTPHLYPVPYNWWSIKKKSCLNKHEWRTGAQLQHLQIKRVLVWCGVNTYCATCNSFHLWKLHVHPYALQKLLHTWEILDFPMKRSKKLRKCLAH